MSVLINMDRCHYLLRNSLVVVVERAGPDVSLTEWDVESAGTNLVKIAVPGRSGFYLHVDDSEGGTVSAEDVFTPGSEIWEKRSSGTSPQADDVVLLVNTSHGAELFLGVDDSGAARAVLADQAVGRAGASWKMESQGVTDARSVHLNYVVPDDKEQDTFYVEVDPRGLFTTNDGETANLAPPGTYYCAVTFGNLAKEYPSGYFGIQRQTDGSKIVIFSMWDPPGQPKGLSAHFTSTSPGVRTVPFGNEGTGTSARMDLDWTWGTPVRFCVSARKVDDGTSVSAYFAQAAREWSFLATCHLPYAEGKLLTGRYYSFVEDFKRDGLVDGFENVRSPWQRRSALFSIPWIRNEGEPTLRAVEEARFTAYPHPFDNIAAETTGRQMILETGLQVGPPARDLGKSLRFDTAGVVPPKLPGPA